MTILLNSTCYKKMSVYNNIYYNIILYFVFVIYSIWFSLEVKLTGGTVTNTVAFDSE